MYEVQVKNIKMSKLENNVSYGTHAETKQHTEPESALTAPSKASRNRLSSLA